MAIILLENESGNTNGSIVLPTVYPMIIAVWATSFGGGTVNLETTPDDGVTWIPITRNGVALTYTSNMVDQISGLIARGMSIRATLTGSTSPSNVNAFLYDTVN